jgi:hypothetical protein
VFLKLMYITNDPEVALIAEKYGVDRIWIDLETLGKEERQKDMDTVKSEHTIEDIEKIKPLLSTSQMLVRVNPWNERSVEEINDVVNAGADIIMLPMWKDVDTVKNFLNCIDGRTKTTLLLETKEAVECIDEVLDLGGFDEIHIGLNDLHLSYGMTFMFELLADGTVDRLCSKFKEKGILYGFGGIAKLGAGLLPSEDVIMEHYRIGSTRAILSRSFCNANSIGDINEIDRLFSKNMKVIKEYEEQLINISDVELEKNRENIKKIVKKIVKSMRGNC